MSSYTWKGQKWKLRKKIIAMFKVIAQVFSDRLAAIGGYQKVIKYEKISNII